MNKTLKWVSQSLSIFFCFQRFSSRQSHIPFDSKRIDKAWLHSLLFFMLSAKRKFHIGKLELQNIFSFQMRYLSISLLMMYQNCVWMCKNDHYILFLFVLCMMCSKFCLLRMHTESVSTISIKHKYTKEDDWLNVLYSNNFSSRLFSHVLTKKKLCDNPINVLLSEHSMFNTRMCKYVFNALD